MGENKNGKLVFVLRKSVEENKYHMMRGMEHKWKASQKYQ